MREMTQGWWDWTVLIGYTIGPWIGLWILGDHRFIKQAVGAGVLFALIASFADDLGVSLSMWWYPEQPIPLMTGNSLWNILGASAGAILVNEIALGQPRWLWRSIVGLALANAAAEYLALLTTDLLEYTHWSPLLSIPVYILLYWLTVCFTRWIWVPAPWRPPSE